MIDTIILKIHSLDVHKDCVTRIMALGSGQMIWKNSFTPIELDIIDSPMIFTYIRDQQKRQDKMIEYRSPIKLKSSHSTLSVTINYELDYIHFNFSIPKFLYGNNIMQFVRHPKHPRFVYGNDKIYNLIQDSYDMMKAFIKDFLYDIFTGCKIDLSLVQLARVDFCFNQFFESQTQKLEYLNYQRHVRKKYSRDASQGIPYSTGVFFKTDRYSFKIYDKGVEYEGNDGRKLKKLTVYSKQDLEKIQKAGDKILRYESTFRSSYMSYIFFQHVFRNKCPYHLERVEKFRELKKKDELQLEKAERKHVKEYEALTGSRIKFMLKCDPSINALANKTPLFDENITYATYTKELHCYLGAAFYRDFLQFQIQQRPQIFDLIKKCRRFNDENKAYNDNLKAQKIEGKMYEQYKKDILPSGFFLWLSSTQNYTQQDMLEFGMSKRSTIFSYKALLRKHFGINNIDSSVQHDISVCNDYSRYFKFCSYDLMPYDHKFF